MVEELRAKAEDSAMVIKKLMQNSQVELAKEKDVGFDVIADNDEKVLQNYFPYKRLNLYKPSHLAYIVCRRVYTK